VVCVFVLLRERRVERGVEQRVRRQQTKGAGAVQRQNILPTAHGKKDMRVEATSEPESAEGHARQMATDSDQGAGADDARRAIAVMHEGN
jgi:hypothetical protein